ncbi:MAG TPA: NAD-dependent epimerase/dehydratase family protein [Gemmatimonadaceae bacterium]|nr:NAD-dependent epimerase/dehydratase family protein [Gemmatimonadaceae bacterium]
MAPPDSLPLNGATILVTGGAGFVGGALATGLKTACPDAHVIALDNLKRAGSELRRSSLKDAGVEFVHGDIRNPDDLHLAGRPIDVILECSAEPSVLAGMDGSPRYVLDTNLGGTINCLELARQRKSRVVFLSTSRVYPTATCNALTFAENGTRFELTPKQQVQGASAKGISEEFPLDGARTLYGYTKLASEMLLQEYAAAYGLEHSTIRFGVISGPGQMGKVEQGVFALWMARHLWGHALTYKGWGGTGKQVRDVVHIDDARDLVFAILGNWEKARGRTLNAGGGRAISASLLEATAACREITGRTLKFASVADTHPTDIRIYLTDNSAVEKSLGWTPRRSVRQLFADLHDWMVVDEARLRPILA